MLNSILTECYNIRMKIKFKQFSRDFSEEYYYVLINQKNLMKHPEKPIGFATKSFAGYLIASSIFVAAGLVLMGFFNEAFPFIFVPILTFVASLHTYLRINKNVKKLSEMDATKFHLELNNEQIIFGLGKDNGVMIYWKEIKKVIFSNNSIVFLPNSIDIFPIVVPIDAEKEVKATLKKLKIK